MEKKSGGEKVWLLNKSAPILDKDGKVSMVLTTSTNITTQKTAEEKIRSSEERFHQLADQAPLWVWMTDLEMNMLYANHEVLKHAGLSHFSQFREHSWVNFTHPEDIVIIAEHFQKALAEQTAFECEARLKNGQTNLYEWFYMKAVPRLEADIFVGFIGTAINIEQQKRFATELTQQVEVRTHELKRVNDRLLHQNELLTASENFNRSLTELSPTMVYIHDIETQKPLFLTNTYLNFVGYNWEQVVALGNKFIHTVVHPDDLALCYDILQKVIKSQEGEVIEGRFRRKNAAGVWVPFFNRVTAFSRNSKNEVTQMIGVGIDISDVIKAEEVLQQKNQDLENMNKELESFAYISSHDLQEPLRKIQTFANRIVEKELDNLSDAGKNYLKRMEDAASRMRTLIDDLLTYSRTNMQERTFENAHLADIVEEIRLEFAEELDKKQAILETNELCACNVIPFQMRQLLHNLISNALKFAHTNRPSHIKIKSEIAKGVKFNNTQLEPEKEYCHMRISDNGIGFEQEYSEKIFEVFQRLHGKEKYRGTGIGLSIVKKIVDNHYGIIIATGELGKGATFDIYIPSTL